MLSNSSGVAVLGIVERFRLYWKPRNQPLGWQPYLLSVFLSLVWLLQCACSTSEGLVASSFLEDCLKDPKWCGHRPYSQQVFGSSSDIVPQSRCSSC